MSKRKADPVLDLKDKKLKEEAMARMMQSRRENAFVENVRRAFEAQTSEVTLFIRHSIVEPIARNYPKADFSEFKLGQDGWVLIVEIKERLYSITCPTLPRAKVANKPHASGDHCHAHLTCENYNPNLTIRGPGLELFFAGKAQEALLKLYQAVQSE